MPTVRTVWKHRRLVWKYRKELWAMRGVYQHRRELLALTGVGLGLIGTLAYQRSRRHS
ncbi:MAG: hypothetical protein M1436_00940 [Acidobacteria bacterium]|nr:hypothetical protein [Acidobacteriota bacterium]